MKKYSVSEFAGIVGVTPQAIYKRIRKGGLDSYILKEDNKIYIIETATDQFKPGLETSPKVQQPVSKPVNRPVESTAEAEALIKQLEQKDKQIEFLQKQIEELTETNREKDRYIIEQGQQLSRLLEQSNELNRNNQLLIGMKQSPAEEPITPPIQPTTSKQPAANRFVNWFKNKFN